MTFFFLGRTQVLAREDCVYFLDGAHTELSVRGCRSWFDFVSEQVLISSTFYTRVIVIFDAKILNEKHARKTLMKLTPVHRKT